MLIKNQVAWDKWVESNRDDYGAAVIRYAERWANVMEEHMRDSAMLEEIAKQTSHEADMEGITGFMYGAAVRVLSECWQYGETLRQWHNLDCQILDEGERANERNGVLNPALLNIKLE